MYKQAAQQRLRFTTSVGELRTEELFGLNLSQLVPVIKHHKALLEDESDDDLDFLTEPVKKDSVIELKFNILKDVYLTKKAILDAKKDEASNKLHNAKIDALIAHKQDADLEEKSIADLEKMRK